MLRSVHDDREFYAHAKITAPSLPPNGPKAIDAQTLRLPPEFVEVLGTLQYELHRETLGILLKQVRITGGY
jgi:hypothetical protein